MNNALKSIIFALYRAARKPKPADRDALIKQAVIRALELEVKQLETEISIMLGAKSKAAKFKGIKKKDLEAQIKSLHNVDPKIKFRL